MVLVKKTEFESTIVVSRFADIVLLQLKVQGAKKLNGDALKGRCFPLHEIK